MINYYNKYLKYKLKYFKLLNKNNQVGGGNKILNLNKPNQYNFNKDDITNNLKLLEKKLGKKFIIKYNIHNKPISINVILKKTYTLTKIPYYTLNFSIPHRTTRLMNIKLDFIDPLLNKVNNNSYISNIHKTEMISGSELVKICLKINEILKINKVYIFDGANITCNNQKLDLTFLKLIEKKSTFYMRFGFDFEITDICSFNYMYSNKDELKKVINTLIDNIRKIKIKNIIDEYNNTLKLMIKIIEEGNKQKLEIILGDYQPLFSNEYYKEKPEDSISDIINDYKKVIDILNKYKKEKYFYKIIIKLFNNDCINYSNLYKNIIQNNKVKIIYGKTIINREYVKYFDLLMNLRHSYIFSYTF